MAPQNSPTTLDLIVARNSNGSVELIPAPGAATTIDRIVVHVNGTPSQRDFPAGGRVLLTIASTPPEPEPAPAAAPSDVTVAGAGAVATAAPSAGARARPTP
jgi:hypothetical protein